jgi:oligopeptide/dipeptide ABC transporter ATP-binding protein
MYAGRIIEDQPSGAMQHAVHHPYTDALLSCYADPRAETIRLGEIPGSPPDLSKPIQGCPYVPRCPLAEQVCKEKDPPLYQIGRGRVACHVKAREAGDQPIAEVSRAR